MSETTSMYATLTTFDGNGNRFTKLVYETRKTTGVNFSAQIRNDQPGILTICICHQQDRTFLLTEPSYSMVDCEAVGMAYVVKVLAIGIKTKATVSSPEAR